MSEKVKVARKSSTTVRVYHTEQCRMVENSDNLKEIRKEIATDRYRECQYCSDEYDNNGGSKDLYHKLRKMGEAHAD